MVEGKMKLTTLIDNYASENSALFNEHGLSFYVEADGKRILFDTGKTHHAIENAKQLNIDLNHLDYVILSHNHYDHGGGMTKLIEETEPSFNLVVGDSFFLRKYSMEDEEYKYIGNNFDEKDMHSKNISMKFLKEDMYAISERILLFSNFNNKVDFEKPAEKLYIQHNQKYEKDLFMDEITMAIRLEQGLLVISGCAHPGIVNILETISERTGQPIYGVIGGTHLMSASDDRIKKTIAYFKEKDISLLGLSHCTGEKAMNMLKEAFKEKFIFNNTGNVIKL